METRSRKRAEASSSSSSGPTTRSKSARLSSTTSSTPAAASSSVTAAASLRTRSSRAAPTSVASMDSSSGASGYRRGRGSRGDDNNGSDKGKEKEHDVRVRDRNKGREQLNIETVAAGCSGGEDDGNDSEEGNLGIIHPNRSSANSALQLLRKLGAGLDELFPSSGLGSASSSHVTGGFKKILSGLRADGDEGKQMEALSQLCDMLSFGTEDSLSPFSDSFVPLLVSLLNHESSPDVMLLAARALTYLCDSSSCAAVVQYGAVSSLVAKLLTIEYMDLAEQVGPFSKNLIRSQSK